MLISIIVAVYNAEKYLERCLESIINQTYQNIEILLINDGSTDTSGKICDEYAAKDSRIRVYHQKNKGVSAVRQLGIEQAKGKYSIHVDSDDWIEKNMIEEMYSVVKKNNCDMLITDFFYDDKDISQILIQKPTKLKSYSIINDVCKGKIHGSTCNKLIKHDLYYKFSIYFPEGINYCEDQLVIIQLLLNIKKVSYLNKSFYHYVTNPESITRNVDKDFFSLKVFPYITELENILGKNFQRQIITNKLLVKHLMHESNLFTFKEIKNFYPETNFHVLDSSLEPRKKIKLFLIHNNLEFLIQISKKIRASITLTLLRFIS